MSILIKGMEMPTSCPCELLGIGYDLHCSFAGGIPARVKEYYECCQNGTRPSWCPLVPVPPHGDLIDRHEAYLRFGKLAETLEEKNDYLAGAPYAMAALFLNNVEEFPTIIPAEEGEA